MAKPEAIISQVVEPIARNIDRSISRFSGPRKLNEDTGTDNRKNKMVINRMQVIVFFWRYNEAYKQEISSVIARFISVARFYRLTVNVKFIYEMEITKHNG